MPGVYLFSDKSGKKIYIGKAKNLFNRARSHEEDYWFNKASKVDHILTESEIDAVFLEADLIKKYRPKYNVLGRYGKTFKFSLPEGNLKKVQKELQEKMLTNAKTQNFERAQKIKKLLERIAYVTSAKYKPWEYQQNPHLVADRLSTEITQLKTLLNLKKLEKIECYDISNTSGKLATGAQVTFVNGIPEKKYYRRYRIISKNSPDDYAMLQEVLTRRLKSEVPLPELFVIDGGKGQLKKGLTLKGETLSKIIALAKRLETIYTDDGKEINLPKNSPALHLLQRLRDEAHRFSRKYHFYLRSKKMLE